MTKIWTHQERQHMDGKQASEKISLENCQLNQDTTTYQMVNVQSTTLKAGWGCGPLPLTVDRNAKWQQAIATTNPGEGRADLSILPILCIPPSNLLWQEKNGIHFILNVTESGKKKEMSGENKLELWPEFPKSHEIPISISKKLKGMLS